MALERLLGQPESSMMQLIHFLAIARNYVKPTE